MALKSEMKELQSLIVNMTHRPVAQGDSWYNSGQSVWDISEQDYPSLPVRKNPLLEGECGDDITSVKQSASSVTGAGSVAQQSTPSCCYFKCKNGWN